MKNLRQCHEICESFDYNVHTELSQLWCEDTSLLSLEDLSELRCEVVADRSLCVSLCLLSSNSYNIDSSSCLAVWDSRCDIT